MQTRFSNGLRPPVAEQREPGRCGRDLVGSPAHLGVLESNLSGSGFEGLRVAKELGLRVTFFTRDLDRYLAIPGSAPYFDTCVDEIVQCETNDLGPLLAAALPIHARTPFSGFLTMGEYDVVVAAAAASKLGLPSPSPDAVALARNKLWMRQRCAHAGVPTPRFVGVDSAVSAAAAALQVGLPCVVKPVDETASADVVRCTSAAEVVDHVGLIMRRPTNTRGQRRFPTVLVEEALAGYEVSVEALAEGDRILVLGVTDKTVAGSDRFVEVGHVFPSLLPDDVVDACSDVAVAALRAVGFDLGLAHVEVKVGAAGPILIEINARPAGGRITDLVDSALGVSCLELTVRQYLGEHVVATLDAQLSSSSRRAGAVRYLTAAPGVVTAVGDLERVRAMPGVRDVGVTVQRGDIVGPLQRNRDRLGHVLTVADHAYVAARQAESAVHEIGLRTTIQVPHSRSDSSSSWLSQVGS